MDQPKYIIERHQHGWIIRAAPGESGVPFESLEKIAELAPKDAVLDIGLAGTFKVAAVVGLAADLKQWREEHEKSIAHFPAAKRWLAGCDVGISSLMIFVALIDNPYLESEALNYYPSELTPSTPRDAADFGRCYRLLGMMPGWEAQLGKVAKRFPLTKWKEVADCWPTLKAAFEAGDHQKVTSLLQEVNHRR